MACITPDNDFLNTAKVTVMLTTGVTFDEIDYAPSPTTDTFNVWDVDGSLIVINMASIIMIKFHPAS